MTRQEAQRDRIVESLRETQARLELGSSSVSMGQWLSLPMLFAGIAMMAWALRSKQ